MRAAKIDLQRMLDVWLLCLEYVAPSHSPPGFRALSFWLVSADRDPDPPYEMTQNIWAPFSMFHLHIYLTQSAP